MTPRKLVVSSRRGEGTPSQVLYFTIETARELSGHLATPECVTVSCFCESPLEKTLPERFLDSWDLPGIIADVWGLLGVSGVSLGASRTLLGSLLEPLGSHG